MALSNHVSTNEYYEAFFKISFLVSRVKKSSKKPTGRELGRMLKCVLDTVKIVKKVNSLNFWLLLANKLYLFLHQRISSRAVN